MRGASINVSKHVRRQERFTNPLHIPLDRRRRVCDTTSTLMHTASTDTERGTMSDAPLTPKALAEDIGIDAKVLRSYLRKTFPRAVEAKNTSWIVPADAATAAKTHFEAQKAKTPPAPTPAA